MVEMFFRNGVNGIARTRHAAPSERDRKRPFLRTCKHLLQIDVESLGKSDELVIGQSHLPILELGERRIGKAGANRECAKGQTLGHAHVADCDARRRDWVRQM